MERKQYMPEDGKTILFTNVMFFVKEISRKYMLEAGSILCL